MPARFPQMFGKYELLEQIASGGMAEVFRARTFGAEGFQKPVAIKRILPHLSTQRDFIAMLTDEAKTVVRLTHANIVEVYDFGQESDTYFVAMEFIDGIDLATLIKHCQERRAVIPPAIAAWIIRDVCRGLAYAHGRTDEAGRPMGIVHRDISPANILVARTGEVKLTDFGIAKAATNIYATDTGVLKGKIAYMAPEQARGNEPDHRADLFSLGLVLYELCTGRRFFSGASQTELLRRVQEIRIAEADIPATVPIGLRKILTRLLAHDPDARQQTAAQVEEDLTIYLSGAAPNFTPARVAQFIQPFLPSEPIWKPLAAVAGIMPAAYQPVATEIARHTTRIKKPIGWLMVGSGIVGDIIKPILTSLSAVLCAVSALGAIGAGVFLRKRFKDASLAQMLSSRLGMAGLFCAASFLIWGVIALIQFATPQRGLIASVAPPVAELQDLLRGIAGKVAVIETTTTAIAKDVKDIKEAILALGNSEALVRAPKTPQEFYHNARVYQLRGMNNQAIEAYKQFLSLAPEFVDAHLTLQLLARDTPGAGALEGWYATLAAKYPQNLVVQTVATQLATDRAARIKALEALHAAQPEQALIALFLAREYYDQGWVGKTESFIKRLNGLFTHVVTAATSEAWHNYFIDKEAADRILEPMRAWQRYAQSMAAEWAKPPMTIQIYEGDFGVGITFGIKEAGVKKILYGIDDPDPKKETGNNPGHFDPITHEPEPQIQVVGTIPDGKHTIYARYMDRENVLSDIVRQDFEPRPFRVLTALMNGPIGAPQVDLQITFAPKAGKRYSKYRYSIDAPTLDRVANEERIVLKGIDVGSHLLYVKGIDATGKETAMFEIPIATE